jgi:hypothetical protein
MQNLVSLGSILVSDAILIGGSPDFSQSLEDNSL